jgi:glycine/D-amino acid oxidase-like deaminating enzyme
LKTWANEALTSIKPVPFWSDNPDAPDATPALRGAATADLVICGGGFTGLWTAIQSLEETPGRRVVLLESETVGFGASTRNGGMVDQSLTHGYENGRSHWPREIDQLVRLGRENFDALANTLDRHGVDADFRRVSALTVATQQWQIDQLVEAVEAERAAGDDIHLLDAAATRARVDSPTYLGGHVRHNHNATVDPARLVWGLRRVAEQLGVTIYEHSPVTEIRDAGHQLTVTTSGGGVITSDRVIVATNAYRPPERIVRRYVIPVYDHVLMTEPLTRAQRDAIGWREREGVDDSANQFHYYRLTADDRILWGGYDAMYHFNNGVDPAHDQSADTHSKLSRHFFETFPQLEGLRFTHAWGGPIGTTSRFTCAWGTRYDARLVWVAGYTGLGVAATRFGARVALDLVDGHATERTELEMVCRRPFPFPPEPLRSAAVAVTKRAIQRADEREGRPGLWLRFLERFGIGFDS